MTIPDAESLRYKVLHDQDFDLDDGGDGDPSAIAEAVGLGKLVAVGYNGTPTWIDPEADDWADVVAEDYGWIQFGFDVYGGDAASVVMGSGDGTGSRLALEVYGTGADIFLTNGDGSISFQATDSAVNLTVQGNAAQGADVVLDVGHFAIAPDGSVGGVAPNTGDVLQWDGSKIVWVTP